MKREINQYLKEWKSRKDRNPLIVRGARQVGKTYVIEEFAKRNFKNCRNLMELIVSAAVYGV